MDSTQHSLSVLSRQNRILEKGTTVSKVLQIADIHQS